MTVKDRLGRRLHDLRVSVTDRCNFRCTYCMPKEVFGTDFAFLPKTELLTFEEITRLARIFAGHGVEKIRLTGGEPLLRRGIEDLIAQLARVEGIHDLTLTTNGSALAHKAQALKEAGLKRVTVSLDALDNQTFMAMNDVRFPVERVLAGIDAAHAAGLGPIKVNMVVKRGVNDDRILDMAEHFRDTPYVLRFIEFMDVGLSNGWQMRDVVSADDIVATIGARWPLEPLAPQYAGEVANRYRYRDGKGEIGVIASVTRAFCGACTRARLSAKGELYTCLFGSRGHDLRALLRAGSSDADISGFIESVWGRRADRYSEIRSAQTVGLEKVEMSYIGG